MALPSDLEMLQRLSLHPLAAPELTNDEIRTLLDLCTRDLVVDYSKMRDPNYQLYKVRVGLRIWGLTKAGRQLLKEQTGDSFTRVLPLSDGL